jgi:hypothetical protein
MDCRRAEELFSDHYEGNLDQPLLAELQDHLHGCESCSRLREALAEVVEALRSSPVVAPSPDLAARAAEAALSRSRGGTVGRSSGRGSGRLAWPGSAMPLPIAAALIMGLAATLGLASSRLGPLGRTELLMEQTVTAREYLLERKERLVEDIRILQVVIATAFEERLDRVNDRVDDYRRLLQERKDAERRRQERRGQASSSWRVLSVRGRPHFQNQLDVACVVASVPAADRS